jgi:hypothetical protein
MLIERPKKQTTPVNEAVGPDRAPVLYQSSATVLRVACFDC